MRASTSLQCSTALRRTVLISAKNYRLERGIQLPTHIIWMLTSRSLSEGRFHLVGCLKMTEPGRKDSALVGVLRLVSSAPGEKQTGTNETNKLLWTTPDSSEPHTPPPGKRDNMISALSSSANLQDIANCIEVANDGIKEGRRRKKVAALRQFVEVDKHKALGAMVLLGISDLE